MRLPTQKDKTGKPALCILDFDGLVALAQSGCLEIHPWGTTTRNWEQPDMITMDLDPAADVEWTADLEAAQRLKSRIEKDGLAAFVKTSGGKGLHVVIPLKARSALAQGEGLCQEARGRHGEGRAGPLHRGRHQGQASWPHLHRLSTQRTRQHGGGPYSTRARPAAAVSMPLDWSELSATIGPAHFTINNIRNRLDDPWQASLRRRDPCPDCLCGQFDCQGLRRLFRSASVMSIMRPVLVGCVWVDALAGRRSSRCAFHNIAQTFLHGILDERRPPGATFLLDRLLKLCHRGCVRLGNLCRSHHRPSDSLAIAQGPQNDAVAQGLEQNRPLAPVKHETGDPENLMLPHRLENDAIGFLAQIVIGFQEVRLFVPDPGDRAGGHKGLDIDRAGAFQRDGIDLVIVQQNEVVFSAVLGKPLTSLRSDTGRWVLLSK